MSFIIRRLPVIFFCIFLVLAQSGFGFVLADDSNLTIVTSSITGTDDSGLDSGSGESVSDDGIDPGDEDDDPGPGDNPGVSDLGSDSEDDSDTSTDPGDESVSGPDEDPNAGDPAGDSEDGMGTGDLPGKSGPGDLFSPSGNSTEEGNVPHDESEDLIPGTGTVNQTVESDEGAGAGSPVDNSPDLSSSPLLPDESGEDARSFDSVTLGVVVITSGTSGTGYSYNDDGSYLIYESGDYALSGDITAGEEASFAIQITASNVTLDGNGFSITGTDSGTGVMIDSGTSGVTVENVGSLSGFDYGIVNEGSDSSILDSTIQSNGYGIYSTGEGATISGNNIIENTVGVYSSGNDATISDNNINYNQNAGIELTDSSTRLSISGNYLRNNTGTGIRIDNTGGGGDGAIYNNYFANNENVNASGDAGVYNWTNPDGLTPGKNIIGGAYIGGNYWSNPNGTGWSDTQNATRSGYSTVSYEVVPGVHNDHPLVGTTGTVLTFGHDAADYVYTVGSIIIKQSGVYYLTGDVTTSSMEFAIQIQASNVILDGNGHTITGSGSGSGVLIDSGTSNVSVGNFAGITNFEYGIKSAADDVTLVNNTVSGNTYGIYSNGDDARILDNDASYNTISGSGDVVGGYGIYSLGNNATISGNNASYNSVTSSLDGGSGKSISATGGIGIYSVGNNVTISDNIASGNQANAIRTNVYAEIKTGAVSDRAIASGGYGIYSSRNDVEIKDNVVNDNSVKSSLSYARADVECEPTGSPDSASITGNVSSTGGSGVWTIGDNVNIINITAINNSAISSLFYDTARVAAYPQSFASVTGNISSTGGSGVWSIGDNVSIINITGMNNIAISSLSYKSTYALDSSPITGSVSSIGGSGVWSSGKNASIVNSTVFNNSALSSLSYDVTITWENGLISGDTTTTGGNGIFSTGDYATITNNIATNNTANATVTVGSHIGNGAPAVTANSSYGGSGIYSSGDFADISLNTASNNDESGIYSSGQYAIISGNTARNNVYGIYSDADDARILDNNANNNTISGSGDVSGGYGIYSLGNNVTISGNTASNNSVTASLDGGNDHSISATGGIGIYSVGNNVIISDNIANGNVANATRSNVYVRIFDGTVTDGATASGGYGIYSSGNEVKIKDNVVNDNSAISLVNYSEATARSITDVDSSTSIISNVNSVGGSGVWSSGDNTEITNITAYNNNAVSSVNYANVYCYADPDPSHNVDVDASASLSTNIRSFGGSGVWSSGNNATITNITVFNNSAVSSANYGDVSTYTVHVYESGASGSGHALLNSNVSSMGGSGVWSSGDNTIIINTTTFNNSAFSYLTYGKTKISGFDNVISGETNTTGGNGILSTGDYAIITNNTAYGNTANETLTFGTITRQFGAESPITKSSSTGGSGLYTSGDHATVTGNTFNNSDFGVTFSDECSDLSLTGNIIGNNTKAGLKITSDSGTGDGAIYNNYFANDENVNTTFSSAGHYTWNNPSGPTLGTSIVGGKYLAGNYWSNPEGDGWSDLAEKTPTGYSTIHYSIASGVSDANPLVGINSSNIPPDNDDDDGNNSGDDSRKSNGESSEEKSNTPDDSSLSSTPPVKIILTGVSVSPASPTPGSTGKVFLQLENTGTETLPPDTQISLSPENFLTQPIGESNAGYIAPNRYESSFSLTIPDNPGTYEYVFQPEQLTTDPDTGVEIRISAGDPIRFTITVSESGEVVMEVVP